MYNINHGLYAQGFGLPKATQTISAFAHIETGARQRLSGFFKPFTREKDSSMDVQMVFAMVSASGLSALNITVINELFSSLAEMARESLSQGKPITATINQPIH